LGLFGILGVLWGLGSEFFVWGDGERGGLGAAIVYLGANNIISDMKRIFLYLVCCLPISLFAQIQDTGQIQVVINSIVSSMPGDSGNHYTDPSAAEAHTWGNMLKALMDGDYAMAHDSAVFLGYELVEFWDTTQVPHRTYYILQDQAAHYWGTYVYYPNASRSLVIQSPHPKNDTNTGLQGAYVFQDIEALFFMLAGTHRCNNGDHSGCSGTTSTCDIPNEDFRISDLAHTVTSIFQTTTDTLFRNVPDSHFIQLHGFGKRSTDPYVILSNGTTHTPSPDYMSDFSQYLFNEDTTLTFKIAHIDLTWTRLRGFTNSQGRLINGSSDPCITSASVSAGRFFHVEQERTKLRNDATGWAKVANALAQTFPTTPLPIEWAYARVRQEGQRAVIEWGLAFERQTKAFYVQRWENGEWIDLATIEAKGHSTDPTYYRYSHPLSGGTRHLYRIASQELSGEIRYSNLLELVSSAFPWVVYPNPASTRLHIDLTPSSISQPIRIYDRMGKLVYEADIVDVASHQIDLRTYPNGIYFLYSVDKTFPFVISR